MDRQYDPNTDPSVIVPVDENGLRLAPNPVNKADAKILPKAVQPFEFQPKLRPIGSTGATESTVDDFQPKKRDVSKRATRTKRTKNIICGIFMLLFTAAAVLPYIFGVCNLKITNPIISASAASTSLTAIPSFSSAFSFSSRNCFFDILRGVPRRGRCGRPRCAARSRCQTKRASQ